MSSGGFHVHGPHDHELEHAAQNAAHGGDAHGNNSFINQIALFTAVIATVGAMFAYMGKEKEIRMACQTRVIGNGEVEVETRPPLNLHGEKFWG